MAFGLAGGAGFDFIDGGAGSDYLFGQDGNDILRGGTDTLVFGPGITPMDGFVRTSGNTVILGVRNPANPNATFEQLTDKITLANWDDPLAIAA
jgi:Ca2+-binding RTX toxin-like protein